MKRTTVGAAVVALFGICGMAHAEWPGNKPIRIVVPFPPGMSVDAAARTLAHQLTEQMKISVIVENRPGGSGHIGASYVAKSKPDGYTLLLGASAIHVVSPHVLPPLNYDPINDFVPIALVAKIPNVLVVHPSVPAKTVPEFLAYAKANPDKLTFGSWGQGGNLHLAAELLNLRLGTHMEHVPYSSPSLVSDFVSGRIQWMFDNASAAMPLVNSGKLRALAVASEDKLESLGTLPSISQYVPGFSVNAWTLLSAPKGTPPEVVTRLTQEVGKAMQSERVQHVLKEQFMAPGMLTGPDAKAFLLAENGKWKKIVAETGVTVKN